MQRSGAEAQLSRDVLDPRPPSRQQPLQDRLDLFADRPRGEPCDSSASSCGATSANRSALCVRNGRSRSALLEHERILAGLELHRAAEVRFVHLACAASRRSSRRFGVTSPPVPRRAIATTQAKHRSTSSAGSLSTARSHVKRTPHSSPRSASVDLFRAGELLVARQPLQGVAERPRRQRRDGDRVVALDPILGPELEPDGRVAAGFREPSIEGEELLGADQDLLRVEQARAADPPAATRPPERRPALRACAAACWGLGTVPSRTYGFSEAMSMTKRYFTSLFSRRS